MAIIVEYFAELWKLVGEMAPYLLFGFLFAGMLRVFMKNETVGKMLKENNFKSILNATLLGIPLPLCSCGVIPAGLSFRKNGASKGSTVSFLISTPQTGVDSILATYSLLGLPFALLRPFVALITGITGGVVTNIFNKEKEIKDHVTKEVTEKKGFAENIKEIFKYGFIELIQDISKWLIIGLLLAALMSVAIPDDFFVQYINKPWLNMLLVLAVSVPLYICATGSIPIAAVLMMKGLSPGAALVFLMAGPATNIATITVLANTLGKKTTAIYLSTIIAGALIFGYLTDAFLPSAWFTMTNHNHGDHHMLPEWLSTASAIALVLLIINGIIIRTIKKNEDKMKKAEFESLANIKKYKVEGMTCKNCKAHVEREVNSLQGVKEAIADYESGELIVTGDGLNDEKIKESVEKAGYSWKGLL
jgi:hypothetical protein